VSRVRTTLLPLLLVAALCALAALLATRHLRAWDLGGRSPVLSYDSAQYALAARELADHHHLATSFALPLELVRHPQPPWPLAVVQPGLVVAEAALFALRGPPAATGPGDPRAWLVLVVPLLAFAAAAITIALTVARLLERHAAEISRPACLLAGAIAGAAFLLD